MGVSSEDSTTSTPALRASGRSWSKASGRYMVDSTTSVKPPAASWRRVWSRNGSLAKRDQRLGPGAGQRAQAGAEPSGENDGLHVDGLLTRRERAGTAGQGRRSLRQPSIAASSRWSCSSIPWSRASQLLPGLDEPAEGVADLRASASSRRRGGPWAGRGRPPSPWRRPAGGRRPAAAPRPGAGRRRAPAGRARRPAPGPPCAPGGCRPWPRSPRRAARAAPSARPGPGRRSAGRPLAGSSQLSQLAPPSSMARAYAVAVSSAQRFQVKVAARARPRAAAPRRAPSAKMPPPAAWPGRRPSPGNAART